MKILVTGANGLLGQKLVKLISESQEVSLFATSRGENRNPEIRSAYTYIAADITNRDEIIGVCAKIKPDVVIHTAAMTNVDQSEQEKEECLKLNVDSVSYLIEACRDNNSFLIHLSTDFIFDGKDGPYTEDAKPNPISYYGESKLKAEQLVLESNIQFAIVRTVLVYGIAHNMSRSNIVLWVKKSLEDGKQIQVVDDQWRTPTLAEDLAEGCYLIAKKRATGIYNISGEELLTPYEMAIRTADYFNLDKKFITKTDGSRFQQVAKRPPRTGFDITKAKKDLGYKPHSFEEGIAVLVDQLS